MLRSPSFCILILIWLPNLINGQLPDQLDPFLEKLFEYEECEEFLASSEYTNIATSKCDPMICDFPRQLCARPAAKFQDKSANTCRNIPSQCLTAANGGVPLGPPIIATPSPFLPPPMPNIITPMGPNPMGPPPPLVVSPKNPHAICKMDAPTGRFCGFRPMFTYNKETLQCDEFWFPGCRTSETNNNLFDNYQECQKIAELCKPSPPTPPTTPFKPRATPKPNTPRKPARARTTPKAKPKKPTPAPSPIVDALSAFGGGGGSGGGGGRGNPALGAIGMFTGSGLGPTGQGPLGNFGPNPSGGQTTQGGGAGEQDLGLLGLIQQGIMGAQAAQGGKGGKEAASKAAGKILEQFTGFDLGGLGNNFGGLFG